MNQHIIDETEPTEFEIWFDKFLEEKDLEYASWEIEGKDGSIHFMSSEVVIENIKYCHFNEQKKIKDMIVKIDFVNGNVLDYFHHLGKCLVLNY